MKINKSIISIILLTLLASAGQFFFKLAAKSISLDFRGIFLNLNLIAGFFMYGLSFIILIILLKDKDLSNTYPALALSFVWVLILSAVIFHESISLLKIAGTAVIIAGVVMLNSDERKHKKGTKKWTY